jgi:hypothetical protein
MTDQKTRLTKSNPVLRLAVNQTLTNMRLGIFNTPKMPKGNGQQLIADRVKLNPDVARHTSIFECRIDGHWRIFYFTNPGGNITALCIGHLDDNNRLMLP